MAVSSVFYINAVSFDLATGVYLDDQYANIAPDGFYGFGAMVRQQILGVLASPQACTTCPLPCGGDVIGLNSEIGFFRLNDYLSTATGPVIIKFYPFENPDGIRVIYNGVTYNKLSCWVDGVHQSTVSTNFTVVGERTHDCGLEGNTTTINFDVYNYNAGWVNYGEIIPVTINPGDVSLLTLDETPPFIMVIPKTTALADNINVEMISPCPESKCSVVVKCPEVLTLKTSASEVSETPCISPIDQEYYIVQVRDAPSQRIDLYDYIFEDNQAVTPLVDGFYLMENDIGTLVFQAIEMSNGVVVSITSCV